MRSIICWMFGHPFELVAMSDLYDPDDPDDPDKPAYTRRATRRATLYHYKFDCCGLEAINPYDQGEEACSKLEPSA